MIPTQRLPNARFPDHCATLALLCITDCCGCILLDAQGGRDAGSNNMNVYTCMNECIYLYIRWSRRGLQWSRRTIHMPECIYLYARNMHECSNRGVSHVCGAVLKVVATRARAKAPELTAEGVTVYPARALHELLPLAHVVLVSCVAGSFSASCVLTPM